MRRTDSISSQALLVPVLASLTTWMAAAPGAFDSGLIWSDSINVFADCNALALKSEGQQLLIAGETVWRLGTGTDFSLVCFLRDGLRNRSFGVDGRVTTDFGRNEEALALAVRKFDHSLPAMVVAAGFTDLGTDRDFALARYDENTGALVPEFTGDGKVVTDFNGFDDVAAAVDVQSDGKIVAVGWSQSGTANGVDFALARYLPTGGLDPEFDADGKVTTHIPLPGSDSWATCMAIQPDGKILVAGHGGGSFTGGENSTMIVARYHGSADTGMVGSLDSTFGNLGVQTVSFDGGSTVAGMALQEDGKIILAGKGASHTVVARLNSAGSLDPSFDRDGKVQIFVRNGATTYTSHPVDVEIQADSKIVVTGQCQAGTTDVLFITRIDPDGRLQRSFGQRGFSFHQWARPSDLLIDHDGNLLIAGNNGFGALAFTVFRFLTAQGDLRVKGVGDRLIGDDVYSHIPLRQMHRGVFRGNAGRRQFVASVENDGSVVDHFRFRAKWRSNAARVSYFSGRRNISAAAVTGTYSTGPVSAGSSKSFKVVIRPQGRKAVERTEVWFYVLTNANRVFGADTAGIRSLRKSVLKR